MGNTTNYRKVGNETFIFANLQRRYFEEYNTGHDQKGILKEHISIFCWPFTDIGNFLLTVIANETFLGTTLKRVVKQYKDKYRSKGTYKHMIKSIEYLYKYFELSGMLLLRRKSIPTFPKS